MAGAAQPGGVVAGTAQLRQILVPGRGPAVTRHGLRRRAEVSGGLGNAHAPGAPARDWPQGGSRPGPP